MARNSGSHFLRRFNPISSVRGKITFILLALTMAAGAAGYSIYQSLDRVSARVGEMTEENLPQLSQSTALMTAANKAKEGMIVVMLSQDSEMLLVASSRVQAATAELAASIEALPKDDQTAFKEDLGEVTRRLHSSIEARSRVFENSDRANAMIRDLQALAGGFRKSLLEFSDNAYFDIAIQGEGTISSIEETLRDLVEQKFAALQALLQIRSEINLLSGAALAIATASDPAMQSILSDLSDSSSDRLADAIGALDVTNAALTISEDIAKIAASLDAAILTGKSGRRVNAAEVLGARQSADALLSSAVDDMVFELTIAADDAAMGNRDAIEGLLNNEVAFISTLLEINAHIGSFQTEALKIATAQSVEQVQVSEKAMLAAATTLTQFRTFGDGALGPFVDGLIAMAEPQTGLASFRMNVLNASSAATIAATQTAEAVLGIADRAALRSKDSQGAIAERILQIDADADGVKANLEHLGWMAVAFVAAALILIHFLIIRPLDAISLTTERLSQGDMRPVWGFERTSDEIARIASALTVFRDSLVEKAELTKATEKERSENQLRQTMAVQAIGTGLARLAGGDLTYRIEENLDEGYAQLKDDFNQAAETLKLAVVDVVKIAESIRVGTKDISQATAALSKRSEHQAATLEETAATIEELAASVNEAAEASRDAAQTTHDARDEASKSATVVQSAVKAMQDIEESSSQIAQIISVIDDIAYQTNLLALNAGVEAARAGDAGRGFAVVASEVRGLSQRTSDAAREIKDLITKSSDQVESGVTQVGRTGATLESIVERVSHISSLVSGIADATGEQATGLDESSSAITQLDIVTQKNASMVEETSAASRTLQNDAEKLVAHMAKFSVATHVAPASFDKEFIDDTYADDRQFAVRRA
jgi:methyl-accepting chemotaxis protein/HAMP domain-containing protein